MAEVIPVMREVNGEQELMGYSVAIKDIVIEDRLRKDYGDQEQEDLIDSMERYGIIQPVILNQEHKLIAGGRRIAAALALNWTHIRFNYRETLSQRELHELELEENLRRKEMTWQERCISIARIHYMKSASAALKAEEWGMRQTGEMLRMALGAVSNSTTVAGLLESGDAEITAAANLSDALKIISKRKENAAMQELARRTLPSAAYIGTTIGQMTSKDANIQHLLSASDILTQGEETSIPATTSMGSLSLISPPSASGMVIPLSSFVLQQPDLSMSVVESLPDSSIDHCITDPPYGIDMSNLAQQNQGMENIDSIESSHGVSQNMQLFQTMFPLLHRKLKPNGFFVLWCDIMQWQNLYNLAVASGFRVQRWPIVWHKIHMCMNNAAQYNFTKNTEIAMVCRKAGATLVTPAMTSVIAASNIEVKKQFGDHPFVKPPQLTDFFLKHIAIQGQTILEPFAGRGSLVMPMLQFGCRVIAVEHSTEHFAYLVENVKQHYLKSNPNAQFV